MNNQPTTRLSDLDLDEIATRAAGLYEYATGLDDAWQAEADVLAGTDVPALIETIRRLRAELAAEQRLHGDTIDDRDQAQDMADKLAYAIAPEEVIGEHSSMNCPWTNALDLITPMAEVDKLRARVAELEEAQRLEWVLAQGQTPHTPRLCKCGHSHHAHTVPAPHGCFAHGQTCPCEAYQQLPHDEAVAQLRRNQQASAERAAAEETHVVADGSDDPEHVDDCPGCETRPVVPAATEEQQ